MRHETYGPQVWGITGETAFLDVAHRHDKPRHPDRLAQHKYVAKGIGNKPRREGLPPR